MTYGKEGILGKDPKDILIKTAFFHDAKDAKIFINALRIADLAWALTLKKAGVLKNDKELLKALIKLKDFQIDPRYGDIYNSKNVALKKLTPYAKDLHISRPRREAINVAFYLKLKEEIFLLHKSLKKLAKTFLKVAKKHKKTIMPDFTYLQHAQVGTFGFYVLTFLIPLLRDFKRLENLYENLDYSIAGSGSVNGASIDIDRKYLAKLLDFSKVGIHARDNMWKSDIPIEAMFILNSIIANIARLNEEFFIFATKEFDILKLPPSLSRASVIMPNKQNPYALTYIRGISNELLGKISSYIAYEKIISGNPDSRTFVYVDLVQSFYKLRDTLELFRIVLKKSKINKKVLKKRAKDSFLYATLIAEYLVKKYNLTYEEAHNEVGRVIRYMKKNNIKPKDIKSKFFKYKIDKKILKPKYALKNKKGIGSISDIDNIIKKSAKKIKKFKIKRANFSFLEKELKEYTDDKLKFTI